MKVLLITLVPLVAMFLFAGSLTWTAVAAERNANRVVTLTTFGTKANELIHQLQLERGRAAGLLAGMPDARQQFDEQFSNTDKAVDEFLEQQNKLDPVARELVAEPFDKTEAELGKLETLRRSIDRPESSGGPDLTVRAAALRYGTIIDDLVSINEVLAGSTDDRELAAQMRAASAFSHFKALSSDEESTLFEVLGDDDKTFRDDQYRAFLKALNAQEIYLRAFEDAATPEQSELVASSMTRVTNGAAQDIEKQALAAGLAGDPVEATPAEWLAAMTKRIEALRQVEEKFGADNVARAQTLREEALRNAVIVVGVALLTLVLAVLVSLSIARSMVRPLMRLRSSAVEVAYQSLPDMVRRLQDADQGKFIVAETAVRAMEVRSHDEIGQVAQAFNAVHHEAVRVASDQAQLRQSVSTMFVNLSRRSQLLVDRLIRLIDGLEQSERDPDRLGELFKLDHLATRMRRNDENLLVLAGADAGRRWTRPAPLIDVLRAATAEVEQYTRVKLGEVDDSAQISAAAVNDLVHLVAELLENATSFSSPRTDVIVDARRAGDQILIEIEDQGIGMSREQLAEFNDRLARPPVFDITVSRMMGLFVVGRLASRHNVRVMLRGAAGGGVLALVTVPATALHGGPAALPGGPVQASPRQLEREPVSAFAEEPAAAMASAGPAPAPAVPGMRTPSDPPATVDADYADADYGPEGYDQAGYDQAGYDQAGYDQAGYDQA
ncbi:MAG TPA: nitrate- and nitrite sensing domain-containing protein, partial [Cryptosporangiaceae bacterium]|nr:nitrate- and nitrite sensing domain-containing protein [Cryptosporangiaceae bacterium]